MDFQVPKITHEEVKEHRGVFVIEPLDRGFGYTFGNSLRRVLLSSLEGAAVTSVKIEGVAHEFTTLPGVREDVTDIILNLKQLVCILHGESPEVEVRLTAKGEGTITAADIEAPADLEILNPELEIANLSSKGRLEITLTIGRGRGYVPAEGNRGQAHTIGVIPVDSMFSPIRRVAYDVEAARVGQRTDYDKLILDITTERLDRPEGRDRAGAPRSSSASSRSSPTSRRSRASASRRRPPTAAARRRLARPRDGELPDRGARARRPLVQLPEARRHRDDRRPRHEDRERARLDPELRQEVDRRGQGDARASTACGSAATTASPPRSSRLRCAISAPARSWAATRPTARRSTRTSTGALIEHGRIKTTVTKAKAVKPIAEQMITLGRRGDLHARRQAVAFLRSKDVVHKLFAEVAPRFAERPGRLHADRQDRPAAGRRGRDGLPRARRLRRSCLKRGDPRGRRAESRRAAATAAPSRRRGRDGGRRAEAEARPPSEAAGRGGRGRRRGRGCCRRATSAAEPDEPEPRPRRPTTTDGRRRARATDV